MAVVEASRRLVNELATMLDKKIKIILDSGKAYEGLLTGFDHPALNILLKNAVDSAGVKYSRIIVKGERISEIIVMEEPLFDPEEFKDLLLKEMKLQEHAVRIIHDARAVEVLGRYRISEDGVMGSGPMAETLYSLYKKYVEQRKKGIQG
ncbi:MAG: Lsm family RNA-binding protein [Desulfurococcaceae archaeon]